MGNKKYRKTKGVKLEISTGQHAGSVSRHLMLFNGLGILPRDIMQPGTEKNSCNQLPKLQDSGFKTPSIIRAYSPMPQVVLPHVPGTSDSVNVVLGVWAICLSPACAEAQFVQHVGVAESPLHKRFPESEICHLLSF